MMIGMINLVINDQTFHNCVLEPMFDLYGSQIANSKHRANQDNLNIVLKLSENLHQIDNKIHS
jgi:hypothetical protein